MDSEKRPEPNDRAANEGRQSRVEAPAGFAPSCGAHGSSHADEAIGADSLDTAGSVEGGAAGVDPEPILRLFAELELPRSLPRSVTARRPLKDLSTVLTADYREVPAFPPTGLAHELLRIVESRVKPYGQIWSCWQDRQSLHQMRRVFNWGDIVVNAQPYMQGTGLSLWGFSCEARVQGRRKFVIFLNTAHDPGAVAATIGHELGHYIYGSIEATRGHEPAAMGTVFAQHLTHEQELFSDAVVALSAYSHPAIKAILGPAGPSQPSDEARVTEQMRKGFDMIDPHYRINLKRSGLAALWRIRYLTLMVHFFKLRSALLDAAGI